MNETFGKLIQKTRKEKGYSVRKLASLCDISHTELAKIEKGERTKPGILTLKGFEKYLDINFEELATMVGYSDSSIEYAEENVLVSFSRFEKKLEEFNITTRDLKFKIDYLKHNAKEQNDNTQKLLDEYDNMTDQEIKRELENIVFNLSKLENITY